MSTRSLYHTMQASQVPLDHHESDLYVKDTIVARAILTQFPFHSHSTFVDQVTGERWIDVPFAYEPWWEARVSNG